MKEAVMNSLNQLLAIKEKNNVWLSTYEVAEMTEQMKKMYNKNQKELTTLKDQIKWIKTQ